jgi:hypothetical protein
MTQKQSVENKKKKKKYRAFPKYMGVQPERMFRHLMNLISPWKDVSPSYVAVACFKGSTLEHSF